MRKPRGFFILVVLVVLAVMSSAVVAQFASSGNNEVVSVRSSDDSKARALAETCLTLMQQFADKEIGTPAPTGDFDALLNPDNSNVINGDEYYPAPRAGEFPVFLPKGLGGAVTFTQRHRWLLVPQTVGTERGGCLIRYEDNSDEALPATQLPSGTLEKAWEGAGATAEVTFADRDRAIYLTAIGIFPWFATTAAADAYTAAHARVTLRRLYSAGGVGSIGTPAIWGGGDVSGIKGPVCGGGISGGGFFPKGSPIRGSGCACGPLNFPGTFATPVQCTPAQCPPPATCGAPSVVTAPPPGPPTANILAQRPPGAWGATFNLFANETFGPAPPPAGSSSNDLSDPIDLGPGTASCKLYYSPAGDVYVWDRKDTAALSTPAPAEDCTAPHDEVTHPDALGGLPRPCTWVAGALSVCAAGQSGCWKPVHVNAIDGAVFRPTGVMTRTFGPSSWGVATGAANYLCGDPNPPISGCSGCDGTTNNAGSFAAGTWTFTSVDNSDMPVPAYVVVENALATAVTPLVSPGVTSNVPLRATFATNSSFTITGDNSSVCGVGCSCPAVANPLPACSGTVGGLAGQSCYAIRAARSFATTGANNQVLMIGAIRAGTVLDNLGAAPGGCYVGDIAAMGTAPASACGAALPDCPIGGGPLPAGQINTLCWEGRSDVVGDMYSIASAKTTGPSMLTGTLAAESNFCSEPAGGLEIFGNILAGGHIQMKGSQGNARLTYAGGGAGTSAIVALRSMTETAW